MRKLFETKVKATNLPQPDSVTCQSACVAMTLGYPKEKIRTVRAELVARGLAGSPGNMGNFIQARIGNRYSFELAASINQMAAWLQAGEFLITHGWFTRSGHVICLDAVEIDQKTLGVRFSVKDPWAEFDFPAWRYLPGANFYDGFYSSLGIYAACVAGQSPGHSFNLYKAGKFDPARPGAWVHRIRPA
ncbi:hypothetical protein [Synechococcus sp. PCC 6312]|uniref:hypothetical protein n=1 Tax=Synechococcus sp. (strain ATCC 27167 / PCC 6312) TaxID=195253 RepID=UPI00029F3658|nr:hypothetical protein [Synechococcus sp. PCC 6312]AFY62085.1 hypothetical protein Syn6312_3031 [Synechococcus sp. PCC 6312]